MTQRVFVDANIFYSKTLMDWLFLLQRASAGMFVTLSSEDVFAEVLANMREKNPDAPGHYTRHRLELMRLATGDVVQDFPSGLRFTGDDPNDYHVHAAAVASEADIILTCDLVADITNEPDSEPYEVMHPDDFFLLTVDSEPDCLEPVMREQINYWHRRGGDIQLDEALVKSGCVAFAARVRKELQRLARKVR